MEKFEDLVKHIVEQSILLKNKYTDVPNATVEFACIFCQSDEEYEKHSEEIAKKGKIVQITQSGYTYQIRTPIKTNAGPLSFVKIRKPDALRKELGDADFNTDYSHFKERYLNNPNFELIKRDNFEMLRLSDPASQVMACFSNIPISRLLEG